ncbi:hypothetical protein LXL04_029080 [Taraxacum kok-saghyz]
MSMVPHYQALCDYTKKATKEKVDKEFNYKVCKNPIKRRKVQVVKATNDQSAELAQNMEWCSNPRPECHLSISKVKNVVKFILGY